MMAMESISHAEPSSEEDQRPIFIKSKSPTTLKFVDVLYTIKIKAQTTDDSKNNKETERKILNEVSGVVHPGEMLALMGPSGSGKTTLLTALSGRLLITSGDITYNDKPISSAIKKNIGFVSQDDILYPHLTVRETLVYTAYLRVPSKTHTKQEKAALAEAIIEELGLSVCRDSMIGGPGIRGVSGGERKRVSIGQELLINPSVLYLDEPTSGLDSTTAQRVVSTLSQLSKEGRTIIMTIHQPSSGLFYMFNKVMLLSKGSPVYFGKPVEAMGYFADVGYVPSIPMNPADFILDLANGISGDETAEDRSAVQEKIIAAYNLRTRNSLKMEINEVGTQSEIVEESNHDTENENNLWAASWWEQFDVLVRRDLKERKHNAFAPTNIIQIAVASLVCGAVWWQSKNRFDDKVGFLFFTSTFWAVFPSYSAIFTFTQERIILTKERASRMYRLSSYFAARMVGDLPMELTLPVMFSLITYWMIGLKNTSTSYFTFLAVILLTVLVGQGIGLAVGAVISNLKSAITFAAIVLQTFSLSGGLYVQSAPIWIRWIKYISYMFYSFKLLLVSQMTASDTYQCSPNATCKVTEHHTIKFVGLDKNYAAIVFLIGLFILCRVISYVALMKVGVPS